MFYISILQTDENINNNDNLDEKDIVIKFVKKKKEEKNRREGDKKVK